MATVTTTWKHVDESHVRTLREQFDTDREARESFNSAIRYYTSCSRAYTLVDIVCKANGRTFNFCFSSGDMEE